ncbi:hypothetical protein SUDANB15_00194 [Streptomyces sp. enrichment culture]
MGNASPSYRGHRYPVEVISHRVWWYFRFPLSFREVEELMLQRGVIVSHETVRRWCPKSGQAYADGLSQTPAMTTGTPTTAPTTAGHSNAQTVTQPSGAR